MFDLIKNIFKLFVKEKYNICFNQINTGKDYCYGLAGGDSSTNYLQYECICCPYFKVYNINGGNV